MREKYRAELEEILRESLASEKIEELSKYLAKESRLPGPRANLELAEAFAGAVTILSQKDAEGLWRISQSLSEISVRDAPANNPREFLTFCGVRGLGALGGTSVKYYRRAVSCLKDSAHDSRWRVREAVAMSIQRLARTHAEILNELNHWVVSADWLGMRAVVASVAEPPLLKSVEVARHSLELHRQVISRVLQSTHRRGEDFKTLRQALGYSLSVVVSALPSEGFRYMRELARNPDPDISWVVRENLKKARLAKSYAKDVASVSEILIQ